MRFTLHCDTPVSVCCPVPEPFLVLVFFPRPHLDPQHLPFPFDRTVQWNGMTYLECQVDSEKQETGGGGLLPALDLLQPGELETDLDEVLVPVSVISANDIQRPWITNDCLRGLVRTYLAMLVPELSNQSMACY